MKVFTVPVFATAQVTARDENHAKEILKSLANSNGEIFCSEYKSKDDGSLFFFGSIDASLNSKLEFCFDYERKDKS